MAEDFAAVSAAKPSFSDVGVSVRDAPEMGNPHAIIDRAEASIQLISRWAGILAFCAALGAIGYFLLG
ncbi:hypothetical protein [Sphingobium yanoikuyae]|uniref:hypothetical protein n=1 Tax=Sphingobium yanoikuyae TaxID=13690 RepID=UPI000AB3BA77|nr:hypothetical protein [Sphingobium yanoikuyae]